MARLFVRLELLTSNYAAAGPTIGVKIRTCHFDDKKGRCRSLKVVQCSRNLLAITPRYTTILIMEDIFKTDRLISKNAVPLSLSGFKSALYRFV